MTVKRGPKILHQSTAFWQMWSVIGLFSFKHHSFKHLDTGPGIGSHRDPIVAFEWYAQCDCSHFIICSLHQGLQDIVLRDDCVLPERTATQCREMTMWLRSPRIWTFCRRHGCIC
jgi:hypothetical protein